MTNYTAGQENVAQADVPSACVVVPTYNEAANISALLHAVLAVDDDLSEWDLCVLVVDDESPDGTGDIVSDIARNEPRVSLLSGPKRGLGSAYLRGFSHVRENMDVDAVVQMDADFSHAPDDIRRLLTELAGGDDVVIGSRYVAGGEIDGRWSWHRRLLSRCGNLFARHVAGLRPVNDCTAGFKAITMQALDNALPFRFNVQGYVFQVALLHYLEITGARIREIPIVFSERQQGSTKLGIKDIAEFFVQVWSLRLLSHSTFIKFALTGLSGVLINLGTFEILLSLNVNPYVSSAAAIEASILSNFLLNNAWTFRHRAMVGTRRLRGLKFNLVSIGTLLISLGTFALLGMVSDTRLVVNQLISIFPGMLVNYLANSYWTFRNTQRVT
jgi:dolichol-phosphate mannosyltransferase